MKCYIINWLIELFLITKVFYKLEYFNIILYTVVLNLKLFRNLILLMIHQLSGLSWFVLDFFLSNYLQFL